MVYYCKERINGKKCCVDCVVYGFDCCIWCGVVDFVGFWCVDYCIGVWCYVGWSGVGCEMWFFGCGVVVFVGGDWFVVVVGWLWWFWGFYGVKFGFFDWFFFCCMGYWYVGGKGVDVIYCVVCWFCFGYWFYWGGLCDGCGWYVVGVW